MPPSPAAPTSSNKTADAAQSAKSEGKSKSDSEGKGKAAPRPSEEGGHGPGGGARVPPEKKPAKESEESLDAEAEDLYDNVACTD